MGLKRNGFDWWRGFLGFSADRRGKAIEILQQQYIDARERAGRFTQHAAKMQYPQFRKKLLDIAADETQHCDWLAEKLKILGGTVPSIPTAEVSGGNSWQSLLAGLDDKRRSAAGLSDELYALHADFPDVAALLRRIDEDGKKHRAEIMDMLMRSDPQAHIAA